MRNSIWFALIFTMMILNPIIFWDKINWLRGLVIYYEICIVFIAWITYRLVKAHYERKLKDAKRSEGVK